METNKKLDKILKYISIILSIILMFFGILIYGKYLGAFRYVTLMFISICIVIVMLMIVLHLYIYNILKNVINKKIIKSILLLLQIIIGSIILVYIKNYVHYLLRNSILMSCYILSIVCLPLITLGISILSDKKYRKIKIIVSLILIIYIYLLNFNFLVQNAKQIVENISGNTIENLVRKEETTKLDLSYLNTYTQKLAKNGYLDKFDIMQILGIADSKSMKIFINYKDTLSNIDLNITNKEDEKIAKLKNDLKSNFYKFNYEINENNEIVINIERYVIDDNNNIKEKNPEIFLESEKNIQIVENINKLILDDMNYNFENNIKLSNKEVNTRIYSLKIGFVYDKENNNYVPIGKKDNQYNFIKAYRVYPNRIEITLNDNIILEKEDYTLRINRYDENLKVIDKKTYDYYYKYEPVVDKMINSNNNTILEIKFNREYTLKELKNIEIIF